MRFGSLEARQHGLVVVHNSCKVFNSVGSVEGAVGIQTVGVRGSLHSRFLVGLGKFVTGFQVDLKHLAE